jgi:phage-related minor tail protein
MWGRFRQSLSAGGNMQKNEIKGAKPESLPPWPSEPPADSSASDGIAERTSGLVRSADARSDELAEKLAALELARAEDAERIAKMTADLARLEDVTRAEKALRDSSLVQIRRLAVLEREAETAKAALATMTAEKDTLAARAAALEEELTALRATLGATGESVRTTVKALADVVRALEAGSGPKIG